MIDLRKIAKVYWISSIFIGPAIARFTLLRHSSGLDCSDGSWGDTPLIERIDVYTQQAAHANVAAGIMILIGLSLLGLLMHSKVKEHKPIVASALPIIFMLGGYGLILLVAAFPDAGCA